MGRATAAVASACPMGRATAVAASACSDGPGHCGGGFGMSDGLPAGGGVAIGGGAMRSRSIPCEELHCHWVARLAHLIGPSAPPKAITIYGLYSYGPAQGTAPRPPAAAEGGWRYAQLARSARPWPSRPWPPLALFLMPGTIAAVAAATRAKLKKNKSHTRERSHVRTCVCKYRAFRLRSLVRSCPLHLVVFLLISWFIYFYFRTLIHFYFIFAYTRYRSIDGYT